MRNVPTALVVQNILGHKMDGQPAEQFSFLVLLPTQCLNPVYRMLCWATNPCSEGCSHPGFFSFLPTVHKLEFSQALGCSFCPGPSFYPCLQQPVHDPQPLLAGPQT